MTRRMMQLRGAEKIDPKGALETGQVYQGEPGNSSESPLTMRLPDQLRACAPTLAKQDAHGTSSIRDPAGPERCRLHR